jgi:hypothetical protein
MWRDMSACHRAQLKAVEVMKRLDNSAACEPTTSSHRHATVQLEAALIKYVSLFSGFQCFLLDLDRLVYTRVLDQRNSKNQVTVLVESKPYH